MNAKQAIRTALASTQGLPGWYLSDLSDVDLLVRPVPGANHSAWQMGHLITAEIRLVKSQVPTAVYPELPTGFAEQHDARTAGNDPPRPPLSKNEYLALFGTVREATLAVLDQLPEADLDKATVGPMAKFAPNLAALLILVSNHTLMHAGQFTVVRRKLGKPVLF
jgi:hypothetical protein